MAESAEAEHADRAQRQRQYLRKLRARVDVPVLECTPIPDLQIATTALHHGLGVVHVDADFDRIGEVRPLAMRRVRKR